MQPRERADLQRIVTHACGQVLPQCGLAIDLEPTDILAPVVRADQLAAFVGFTSDALRGALVLLVPVILARGSYPLPFREGTLGQLDLFDWCGEITNRLMGRVKAGLAERGVVVEPSTPKAMMAEQVRVPVSEHASVYAASFGCENAAVIVMLDAISLESQLFRTLPDSPVSHPEGMLLFL
jgi:hypothetical protein